MKNILYLLLLISGICSGSEDQNHTKSKPLFRSVYIDNKTPFCIKAYIRGSIQSSATHHYEIVGDMETIAAHKARILQIKSGKENPLCSAVVVVYMHNNEGDMSYLSGIENMQHANISVEYRNQFYLSILQ